jgi:hypothetical protein
MRPPSAFTGDGDPLSVENLKATRQEALETLASGLDAVLVPAGFARRPKALLWIRNSLLARTYVEVQRSQSGLGCYINLGRERPFEKAIPTYRNNTAWRLGLVAGGKTLPKWRHRDAISYVDLTEDPAFGADLVLLVRDYGLPYLRRCQGLLGHRVRPPEARRPASLPPDPA